MNSMPSVIVNKGGFFTSLVKGVFTLLTTIVICASGVGVYTLHLVNSKFSDIKQIGQSVVEGMPKWRQSLPPALADAINDRRAGEYQSELGVSVTLVDTKRRDRQRAVIEVKNNGNETVSLLALNIRLEDVNGVPVRTFVTYGATPLAIDDEWRGPLLPGATRKFVHDVAVGDYDLQATAEIADVRVACATPVAAEAPPVVSKDESSTKLAGKHGE